MRDRRCRSMPPDVPSTLLERRPDIAAAERLMAAANAQIGVAVAAFYPDHHAVGRLRRHRRCRSNTLLRASNRVWSFGPTLDRDRVRRRRCAARRSRQARAVYDQNVANYRQTVLTGVPAGRGPARGAAHPGAAGRGRGRTRCGGARGRAPDPQPVPGRHRRLYQRHHGADPALTNERDRRSTSGRTGSSPASR